MFSPGVLHVHLPLYSAHAISIWEEESFCYMFFPSHHLSHRVWKLHCSLCTTLRRCFLGDQQNCSFAEHCPVPILKSLHLQSQKQDCETGPEESHWLCKGLTLPPVMMFLEIAILIMCHIKYLTHMYVATKYRCLRLNTGASGDLFSHWIVVVKGRNVNCVS